MAKTGRNDLCPCGSGTKYKRCCLQQSKTGADDIKEKYYRKYKIRLKEEADVQGIRKAGDLVVRTLELVQEHVAPGISTERINQLVHDFTVEHGAVPAPLGYSGFPKSVCISVNEVICHGIPGEYELREGDIVNVDVTSRLQGYYADASRTFKVGEVSPEAERIIDVSYHCLKQGLQQVAPGNTIGDIGWAIQGYAERQGCSVVREMVGHGTGFAFHEPPQVPHFGEKGQGIVLVPGMVFTVEPMINLGSAKLRVLEDNWTAVTRDGSLSAQFEKTVAVSEDGCQVLTPWE